MKYILLLMLVIPMFDSKGQNVVYYGKKSFPATDIWEFQLKNSNKNIGIQIAKAETGGYLKLSVSVMDEMIFIGGDVLVFLSDGTMITCTDKGIKDYVDNESVVLYFFTSQEIEKLKKSDIVQIRFTIKCKPGCSASEAGSFTAINILPSYSERARKTGKTYIETSVEISSLFR